jgi:hypothetical protein
MKRYFDYTCNECNEIFADIFLETDDRDVPTQEPCPVCNKPNSVVRLWSAPAIGDSVRQGRTNLPSSWTDKLTEMKSKHRHSTIKVPAPSKREF